MTEIVLADGTVINQATGRPVRDDAGVPSGFTELPSNAEAVEHVTRVRRRLSDLPDVPDKMHPIALTAAYYLFGLEDWEIASAMHCTEKQVGNMRMTEAFSKLIGTMQKNVVEAEEESVRSLVAENALNAARTMANGLTADSDQIRIVAAKDILDRAGHRPNDVIEHKHSMSGGLTIEYVQKKPDSDYPVIDIDAKEYSDANG